MIPITNIEAKSIEELESYLSLITQQENSCLALETELDSELDKIDNFPENAVAEKIEKINKWISSLPHRIEPEGSGLESPYQSYMRRKNDIEQDDGASYLVSRKSEIQSQKTKINNLKPEISNQKSEIENRIQFLESQSEGDN